mmetsp:Transcript_27702/g.78389  ORF Transcript_27702/g.78389 Transcript_27702/m.78389 type:complete len:231 (+) Transcript_27702:1136-1828(+)
MEDPEAEHELWVPNVQEPLRDAGLDAQVGLELLPHLQQQRATHLPGRGRVVGPPARGLELHHSLVQCPHDPVCCDRSVLWCHFGVAESRIDWVHVLDSQGQRAQLADVRLEGLERGPQPLPSLAQIRDKADGPGNYANPLGHDPGEVQAEDVVHDLGDDGGALLGLEAAPPRGRLRPRDALQDAPVLEAPQLRLLRAPELAETHRGLHVLRRRPPVYRAIKVHRVKDDPN